jgi:hypothetical protein
MKQIYTNTTEKVYIRVYSEGVLTDATSDPTFSISTVGSDATPRTGTATKESTGVYFFVTELEEASSNRTLKVDWSFNLSGDFGTKTDYLSVVTPYVDFMDIKDMFPGESDEEIENAELFSRFMINAYTGIDFGPRNNTVTIFGNDKATLVLPYRIERLDSIAVNDELLWTRDPEYNALGRIISITDTNYGLLSEKSDNVPVWSDFQERAVWNKNYKYAITGLFGWQNIPDEVEYCAKLLADDYFCKDTAWKKKYVDQINASDWRLVFNSKQFNGTGNFFADKILQDFRSINMVII